MANRLALLLEAGSRQSGAWSYHQVQRHVAQLNSRARGDESTPVDAHTRQGGNTMTTRGCQTHLVETTAPVMRATSS